MRPGVPVVGRDSLIRGGHPPHVAPLSLIAGTGGWISIVLSRRQFAAVGLFVQYSTPQGNIYISSGVGQARCQQPLAPWGARTIASGGMNGC